LSVGGGKPISRIDLKRIVVKADPVSPQACTDVNLPSPDLAPGTEILSPTPPAALGNLSLTAYVAKANTLTLHFCNVSPQASSVPAGEYSFVVVR